MLDPIDLYIRQVRLKDKLSDLEDYVFSLPLTRHLEQLKLESPVTFLVGENGSGKSTLLEAIALAAGFNAEGGSQNFRFSTQNTHSQLYRNLKLIRGAKRPKDGYFLRAESFYNVASKAEDYRDGELPETYYARYGGKSLHQRSHGESFLALVQGDFVPGGLYLLDEPEAALSPQSQLSLLLKIHQLAAKGAQFIIASHSPILLGLPGAGLLAFDDGELHACTYEETESYQVTEMFINERTYLLERLLREE